MAEPATPLPETDKCLASSMLTGGAQDLQLSDVIQRRVLWLATTLMRPREQGPKTTTVVTLTRSWTRLRTLSLLDVLVEE